MSNDANASGDNELAATESGQRSTSVEHSQVVEKGMVIDSALPITPVALAPTDIAQPPSALLGSPTPAESAAEGSLTDA
jgi:hypothetical protein